MQILRISQMLGAFNPLNMNLPTTTDKIYYVNFSANVFICSNGKRFFNPPFLFVVKLTYFNPQ